MQNGLLRVCKQPCFGHCGMLMKALHRYDHVIPMPCWCDYIVMLVRLLCHGAMMAILSCHDYFVIAVRLNCHRTAMTTPSYRRLKAMLMRLLCDDAAITMRWLIFLIYFHSKDTAKRFPDVTTPYYSRHFNLRRKKLGFCDSHGDFFTFI